MSESQSALEPAYSVEEKDVSVVQIPEGETPQIVATGQVGSKGPVEYNALIKNKREMDFVLMDVIASETDIVKALMGLGVWRAVIVIREEDVSVSIHTHTRISKEKYWAFINKLSAGLSAGIEPSNEVDFLSGWKKWRYIVMREKKDGILTSKWLYKDKNSFGYEDWKSVPIDG